MKTLAVDIEELACLMENVERLDAYYLDTQTGETIILPEGDAWDFDPDSEDDEPDVADWEKDLVPIVSEIRSGSERYQPIPAYTSSEGYRLMERFAATVTDPGLKDRLAIALNGRGAFRRFKDVLYGYAKEQERWFAYHREAMAKEVRAWLEGIGIEPIDKGPPPQKGQHGQGSVSGQVERENDGRCVDDAPREESHGQA
jgi:hypothetical protein